MRIALFHNLPSGGAKRAACAWTRLLAVRHTVDVFTLSTADHDFCDLRPYANQHRIYPLQRLQLFESPFGRINQLQRWRELRRLERIGASIAADIDAGRYDVVLVKPCIVSTTPGLLRYLRRPSVYYLQEPVGRALPTPPPQAGWRGPLDALDPFIALYRRRLRQSQSSGIALATTLLANSSFVAQHMHRAYQRDVSVVPCGVDTEAFRPLPGITPGRHVLSVGELSPRKGFFFLVEALAHLPAEQRPALRLACNAVREDERRRVEDRARTLGVRLDVRVGLDTEALAREYNEAALVVYAPHDEPFGLVPIEAMACARAVVGIREGGVSESIVDNVTGRLLPRDPRAFAAAISEALSSTSQRVWWGAQGREHVLQRWSWAQSANALETHLRTTAERLPPAS